MERSISKLIPAIYQNNFLEITLWTYIQALRNEGFTLKEAWIKYREHFKVTEDELPLANALMIYHRRHKEFCNLVSDEGRSMHQFNSSTRHSAIDAIIESVILMLDR